jgi:hypothetical protein
MIIKEKIRGLKEQARTFELKRQSLKDKVDMQKDFIRQIEEKSQEDIRNKGHKISSLLVEENNYTNRNIDLTFSVQNFRVNSKTLVIIKKNLRNMETLKVSCPKRFQHWLRIISFLTIIRYALHVNRQSKRGSE